MLWEACCRSKGSEKLLASLFGSLTSSVASSVWRLSASSTFIVAQSGSLGLINAHAPACHSCICATPPPPILKRGGHLTEIWVDLSFGGGRKKVFLFFWTNSPKAEFSFPQSTSTDVSRRFPRGGPHSSSKGREHPRQDSRTSFRMNLNIEGVSIDSRSHTHPSQ